jgi:endonuclease/exonuclease/phosphatase family metal-dependent hydrolase
LSEVRIAARTSSVLQSLGRFLIPVFLVCALALALVLQPATGDAWWIELLRYAPYPIYLAPTLLGLALSLSLGWAWRATALASVALIAIPVMGLTYGKPQTGSTHLRVMTYNIKSHRADERPEGYAPIAEEVLRHNPDVLVLQDADRLTDGHAPMPEVMRRALAQRQLYTRGQYIIASRHPLRGCDEHPLPEPDSGASYVRCTLRVGTQAVDLVTVHLISPRDGLNATRHEHLAGIAEWKQNFKVRLIQARQLVQDLATTPLLDSRNVAQPLIVAGDLNAPESSPVMQSLLAHGLRDTWSSSVRGYGYTHGHSLRPNIDLLRIDHILVGAQVGIERTFVGGTAGSDHRPVIADIWLSRNY